VLLKKTVTGIILMLLLAGLVKMAFKVQPVLASGTIYIRTDGSIDPPTAPIQRVGDIYTLTGNIVIDSYSGIVIQRDSIVFDGAGYTIQGNWTGSGTSRTGIDLSGRRNVTIKETEIRAFYWGVYLYFSFDNSITRNNLTNLSSNVLLWNSSNNRVVGNDVSGGAVGVWSNWSFNNTIVGNNLTNNTDGIVISHSFNDRIENNTVTANQYGVYLFYYSENCSVMRNAITANSVCGLMLDSNVSNAYIASNNITRNCEGISIWSSQSNTIFRNEIRANDEFGIRVFEWSSNNSILENDIVDNFRCAIYSSLNSRIINNTFTNDGLHFASSYGNKVEDNVVNGKPLVYLERVSDYVVSDAGQVILVNCSDITVENLTLSEDTPFGVDLWGTDNSTIRNNNILMYGETRGLYLRWSSHNNIVGNNITTGGFSLDLLNSHGNNITGNSFAGNRSAGINLFMSLNNSISSNTFAGAGLYVYDSYGNQVEDNVVNGKPLVYLENVSDCVVNDAGQVVLVNSNGVLMEGLQLSNTWVGLELWGANNSRIENSNIINNVMGIILERSWSNSIVQNNIVANSQAIHFSSSANNSIIGNNITANEWGGIQLFASPSNLIYHNNFVGNGWQALTDLSSNAWDCGYLLGGNYWSNYKGTDVYSGSYQNETGSDGIGDTPYAIDANNTDKYPLVNSWVAPETFNVTGNTFSVSSNATVQGDFEYNQTFRQMSFNLSGSSGTNAYCRIVYSKELLNETIAVLVNGTAIPYTLVENGTHCFLYFTLHLSLDDIRILETITGDVNGDRKVELKDVYAVAKAYGSVPGHPRWNPLCDINKDGKVELKDYYTTCKNYGKHW
jgi:parallel beta-helix repeat protein